MYFYYNQTTDNFDSFTPEFFDFTYPLPKRGKK